MDWKPISIAPFDRYLELAVINTSGTHAVAFPCRGLHKHSCRLTSEKKVTTYADSMILTATAAIIRGQRAQWTKYVGLYATSDSRLQARGPVSFGL